jgi:hypothetical protein
MLWQTNFMLPGSNIKARNPLAVLASSVLVGVATFVVAVLGLARLARVVTHTLDGLGIWIVFTLTVAISGAFVSFLLMWRWLNRPNRDTT